MEYLLNGGYILQNDQERYRHPQQINSMEHSMNGDYILQNDQERYRHPQQVMDYPSNSHMNPHSTSVVAYATDQPYMLQNEGYEKPQYITTSPVQNPMSQYGTYFSAVRKPPTGPYYNQSVIPVPFSPINRISRIPANVMPEYSYTAPVGSSNRGLPVQTINNLGGQEPCRKEQYHQVVSPKKLNLQMMSVEGCDSVMIFKRTQQIYQQVSGDELKPLIEKLHSEFCNQEPPKKRGKSATVNKKTKSSSKKSSSQGQNTKNKEEDKGWFLPKAKFLCSDNGRTSCYVEKRSNKACTPNNGWLDFTGKHRCLRSCERKHIVSINVESDNEVEEDHPKVGLSDVQDGMKCPAVSGENPGQWDEMENNNMEPEPQLDASFMESSLARRYEVASRGPSPVFVE